MNPRLSLDHQYLEFDSKTSHVFSEYPQMEALRYWVFRNLVTDRMGTGWTSAVKQWVRPILRRGRSVGDLTPADVLMLVEGDREVIVGAVMPLFYELKARGVSARLIAFRAPSRLADSAVHFDFSPRALPPPWAKAAWRDLCNVVERLGSGSFTRSFYSECASAAGLLDEANRVLDGINPKVVLTASTQAIGGSAFVVTGRSHGATTLLLQHGMLQPVYVPLLADRMLTWGKSSNEILTELGVSGERLIALGSPRHDQMTPTADRHARAKLLTELSLPNRPTFVFFSNGNDLVRNGDAPGECARWLEATAAQYSGDANIIVRLHPNEDGSLYRDCPHLVIDKGSRDLAAMLRGSDTVGSLCSTVMYDALLFNKPVWQFYADGWPELANNCKSGLATRIRSQADFIAMVGRMVRDEGCWPVNEGLAARVFANRGCASKSIADFVGQQIGGETLASRGCHRCSQG